jgi:hypothetical protein
MFQAFSNPSSGATTTAATAVVTPDDGLDDTRNTLSCI